MKKIFASKYFVLAMAAVIAILVITCGEEDVPVINTAAFGGLVALITMAVYSVFAKFIARIEDRQEFLAMFGADLIGTIAGVLIGLTINAL